VWNESNTQLISIRGRRGHDRMVVVFTQLPMQLVPITTDVVGSIPAQVEMYNIM
jgi:hypothetical protein